MAQGEGAEIDGTFGLCVKVCMNVQIIQSGSVFSDTENQAESTRRKEWRAWGNRIKSGCAGMPLSHVQ